MVTINVSPETKELFKKEKLKYSNKLGRNISEDEFIKILLKEKK